MKFALALAGCGGMAASHPPDATVTPDAAPDAAPLVAADFSNSAGKDEDPNLVALADGSVVLAWFSERTGAGDIYYRRTTDGITWEAPVQVSSTASTDVYPGLAESPAGTLHAVMHRYDGDINATSRIIYSRGGSEQTISTGVAWSPTIAATPSGVLVVAFAANPCAPSLPLCFQIGVTRSIDGGRTWSAPSAPIPTGGEADAIPFVAWTGDHLTLVWNRYVASTSAELPWMAPTSDVMVSTSTDGTSWSTPIGVTSNSGYNLFPALYADHSGAWWMTWQTSAGVVAQTLATAGSGAPTAMVPTNGYSTHAIATSVPGRYVSTWVEGSSDLEIWTRPFER